MIASPVYNPTIPDPADQPGLDFEEWCETPNFEDALKEGRRDGFLGECLWERLPHLTLVVCMAFADAHSREEYRPYRLTRHLAAPFDQATLAADLIDGAIDMDGALEIALFATALTRAEMPAHIRELCAYFRATAFEAAQQWSWVREIYEEQAKQADVRRRCRCSSCVCN